MKILFYLICAFALVSCNISKSDNRWTQFGKNGIWFVDFKSISATKQQIKTVRVRTIVPDAKVKEDVIKYRNQKGLPTAGYDDLYEFQSLIEINCSNKKSRAREIAEYDKNGKMLDRDDRTSAEWELPVPNTFGEALYNKVCLNIDPS